jgi:hypothetical protein
MFGFVGTVEEELQIGTTKMRLLVSKKGKRVVELWSSLSDAWRVTHRESYAYDQWLKWKATAENIKI